MPRPLSLVFLLVSNMLAAQNSVLPKQPLSSVSGQVVLESAGTPLHKVLVQLAPSEGANVFRQNDRESRHTLTDSKAVLKCRGFRPVSTASCWRGPGICPQPAGRGIIPQHY